jgi:hypothetical protein
MTGQATFSLADDEDLAGSVFLAAVLSAEPLLLAEEESLEAEEDSPDVFSFSLVAATFEPDPFRLSVR